MRLPSPGRRGASWKVSSPGTSPRVLARIEGLAAEPRPSAAKKLQGSQHLWRIRVGDWRVVYAVNDRQRVVDIVRIRHRRDVYR